MMTRSRLLDVDDKNAHPSSAIVCSGWVVVRCCGHHSPPFLPWNPLLYHLLSLLPILNLLSPYQKSFFSSSFLFYISFLLFNFFIYFLFIAMFSKSKLMIFFPYYISCYNCHPSSFLVSTSIYFTTSLNFYSPFLISCYKRFAFFSLTHPCISLIYFSISEGNRKNHNDLRHNNFQQNNKRKERDG